MNIKPSEFMEKYWRVAKGGGVSEPLKLHPGEAEVMDTAFELGVPPYFQYKSRRGTFLEANPVVESAIKSKH